MFTMDDKYLIDTLYPFNFWKERPFTGISRPKYVDVLKRYVNSGQIIVTKGVRRSGKTTLLFQFLASLIHEGEVNPNETLYVNFEDPRLPIHEGSALLDRILRAHRAFVNHEGVKYLVLDEVQRLPEWERWTRIQHEKKKGLHILVSGSSSKILSKELATLLTGRHLDLEVFPLDLSEFYRFRGYDPEDLLDPEISDALATEYISSSMFPQIVLTEETDLRERMLQDIYRDILEHDVARRYEIREVDKLEAVSNLVLSSVPGPVTITKVRKNLNNRISLDTINRYFKYLQEPFLIFFLFTHSFKAKEIMRGSRKVYSIDSGLLKAVSHRFSGDRGKMLENAIYLDIRRSGLQIFRYYGKKEVDFLVWGKDVPFALVNACLEIRNENTRNREVQGLQEAMEKFRMKKGTIVTMRERDEIVIPEGIISIVPYTEWVLRYWPHLLS